MSFSVIFLIAQIIAIVVMGFLATHLRKKNKAKFLELNLNAVKDLKQKDIDLYAIKNMLRMDDNDPTVMEEGKIEFLKQLGVDVEAMQREAMRVKKEQDDYDNDPTVSEEEREQRRLNRIEEREREERERQERDSQSSSSSSNDSSSSSGDGGGFDGGGAGASW